MNFKKTKVEVVKQKNPFPNLKVSSDAAIVYSPFVEKKKQRCWSKRADKQRSNQKSCF